MWIIVKVVGGGDERTHCHVVFRFKWPCLDGLFGIDVKVMQSFYLVIRIFWVLSHTFLISSVGKGSQHL